ncbi:MAG: NAD(P)-dependent alcohol dehydrogenase [Actinobacteria bacterium]|nr:NAD(P)-dependent alcohol dehydrogenase [Actinomycetota bacterium]
MKAAVVERYGPPEAARVADVEAPVPKPDEVRVRVLATAVTSGDARIRAGRFPRGFAVPARLAFGLTGPRRRILGTTFSGVVDMVGARVSDFSIGDAVCGMTGARMGTHAEHVTVPVKRISRKPAVVSHDDAAGLLFGGSTALWFLRDKGRVGEGASVLVNGASGAVGTNAVQLARHFGASVTAVTSAPNAALVERLGAERVIDHTTVDVTTIGDRFDVVLDTVGNLSIATGRALLRPGGVLLLAVADLADTIRARGRVVAGSAPERVADFDLVLGLVADGAMVVVHDQTYPLDDIAEAYRRVDGGHKVGNVVVRP